MFFYEFYAFVTNQYQDDSTVVSVQTELFVSKDSLFGERKGSYIGNEALP